MEPHASLPTIGTPVSAVQACRLCGRPLTPDALGLMECMCGWGGPGDPLEHARGIARMVARLDRRLANTLTRRDFTRLQSPRRRLGHVSGVYLAVLFIASTAVYLFMLGLLAAGVAFAVSFVEQRA
jgi:hypothetical protein